MNAPAPTRVLLADDHVLFAELARELLGLQGDMTVVGTATSGSEAVRSAAETSPDVVLMDHFMPGMNGTAVTRLLKRRDPRIRVLMMSACSDAPQVVRAMRAGATGFVAKWCHVTELLHAIREVAAGRRYIQRDLADAALAELTDGEVREDPIARLSVREHQVFQMMAEGRSTSTIAGELCLSVKTIETHRARLMRKLGIANVAGLVKLAMHHNVIPPE